MADPLLELVTRRLRMRPLLLDDLEDLAALHSDRGVMLGRTGAPTAEGRSETEAWLDRALALPHRDGCGIFRIGDRTTEEFIGRGGIRPKEGTGDIEILYALRSDHWGIGLGMEVAAALLEHALEAGVTTLVGEVLVENVASQRILRALGFSLAGEGHSADDRHLNLFRYEGGR